MENSITIENGRIMFRNFAGAPTKFNSKGGVRDFAVCLSADMAEQLAADGWNIKQLQSRDEEEEPLNFMKVKVSFTGNYPPNIYMIAGKKKQLLTEDTVSLLDVAEIQNVDMVIRPYRYDVNGKQGASAYLKSMYVTLVVDELAAKYEEDDITEMPFN